MMSTPRSLPHFGGGSQRFIPGSAPRPGFARPLARPTPSSAGHPSSSVSSNASRATQLGLGLGKGKGKGAAGLGTKGALKRHKKVQRDTIQGITKGDIRRLARRGGIKRISATVYEDIRNVLRDRLRLIMQSVTAIVESDPNNRKTVVVQDVIFTLNRLGTPIYGFEPTFDGKHRKG